jgi:hypothetical protein
MKVSFDFDSTLELSVVQDFARKLIKNNIQVWCVTSRFDTKTYNDRFIKPYREDILEVNKDLIEVLNNLKIQFKHLRYTNMANKSTFFQTEGNDFVWHLDDDLVEVEFINENTNVVGINHYDDPNWKERCLRLLRM